MVDSTVSAGELQRENMRIEPITDGVIQALAVGESIGDRRAARSDR